MISILELKYNIILSGSGKYNNVEYQKAFEGIPTTTFMNANDFSSVVGLYFIYLYAHCKSQKNKFRFVVLPVAFFIIALANSRGVLISVCLVPLVYSLYNKEGIFKTLCVYLFLVLVFFLIVVYFKPSSFYLKKYLSIISNIKNGSLDSSSLYRLNIISYTIINIDKLLIGYGPYGSSIFLEGLYIINPHNFFLEILIDYGLVGLILVMLIFFGCFKLNLIISKSDVPEYLRSSCGAVNILFFLYIIISSISSSFLNYWSFCWFPVYLTMMHGGIFNRLKGYRVSEMNNRFLEYAQ
jgi:O-antigen ligase